MFCVRNRARVYTWRRRRSIVCLWPRTTWSFFCCICRIQNPDTPRAWRFGRRTTGRLGGAGPAQWDTDVFIRTEQNCPSCPTRHRRHEQGKSYVNHCGNKKRPVDERFITGTKSALCSWLLTNVPTPIVFFANLFHARHVWEYAAFGREA